MVKIEFLGPIDKDNIEVDIENLNQLKEILSGDKKLKPWLEICAIALNDTFVKDLNLTLKDGDKISLLPPVCGG